MTVVSNELATEGGDLVDWMTISLIIGTAELMLAFLVDWLTILLIIGTAGLLLAFLVYRRATFASIEARRQEDRRQDEAAERRRRPASPGESPRPPLENLDAAPRVPRTNILQDILDRILGADREAVRELTRLIMQVLITFVGVAFGVLIIFDGCYAWLGWRQEPATDASKNWASVVVGTVIGFWMTKS